MTQDFRRKKIRVLPTGVEPMTIWLVLHMLCHCAIGDSWQAWLFNWVYGDKLLAYCWTGMSNVMLVWNEDVNGDVNEDGKVEAWLCKWKMQWCYSLNKTGKLGKKNSEFTLFEPTTFRLVLRMLYHWALRDSSQAWLQTIVECCSKFQILISSGVNCYFETPFSKIIHDIMSKWREKSFLTRKLFSSVRQKPPWIMHEEKKGYKKRIPIGINDSNKLQRKNLKISVRFSRRKTRSVYPPPPPPHPPLPT